MLNESPGVSGSAPHSISPLLQLARLVPNASFAIVRDLQRAAVDVLQHAEPMLVQLLERIVEILPIDSLLARVDVDALVRQVDVDALVGRVDIDAIVARVDLERIVAEVLAGIEIGDLIHDSTNSIASDVRDTVRSGAASVDGRIARIVDRFVRRGRERDLVLPGYPIPGVP